MAGGGRHPSLTARCLCSQCPHPLEWVGWEGVNPHLFCIRILRAHAAGTRIFHFLLLGAWTLRMECTLHRSGSVETFTETDGFTPKPWLPIADAIRYSLSA